MGILQQISSFPKRITKGFNCFRDDNRGVGAVEFALIAPLMFGMYIGAVEATIAISANRKLARISSSISDIITQSTKLGKADIRGIMEISKVIMEPFSSNDVQIKIVALNIDPNTKIATVDWSYSNQKTGNNYIEPYIKGTVYPEALPNEVKNNVPYIVTSKVTYGYTPMIGYRPDGSTKTALINMKEQLYLRPRLSEKIELEDN